MKYSDYIKLHVYFFAEGFSECDMLVRREIERFSMAKRREYVTRTIIEWLHKNNRRPKKSHLWHPQSVLMECNRDGNVVYYSSDIEGSVSIITCKVVV